jgi:CP family cyanate transporter-like MFS transporter
VSADADRQPPALTGAPTDWPAVLAALACGIAVSFNIGKVPIALGQLRAEFGLSLVAAGWVASTFNTLAVLSAVFFGMACDRVGHLRMAVFGLTVSLLAGFGALFAPDIGTLLLSRIFEGVGFLSVAVSAPGLISTAAQPVDRRFALGLWASFMPCGVGLAMVLGPLVMPLDGWRALWLAALAGLILSGIVLVRHRAAYGHAHASLAAGGIAAAREALTQPAPWLFALALGSWAVQYFALVVWLPTFLREQRGLAPTAVGLLSALVVIINAPGTVLGGALIQRHYRRGQLIAAASALTLLLSLGVYLEWLPDLARYLCCLALSLVGGLIPAAVLSSSLVLAKSPRQIGTLQGLFMQGGNLGQFSGPPLIAAVVSGSGHWGYTLVVTGTAAAVGIGLGIFVGRAERAAGRALARQT